MTSKRGLGREEDHRAAWGDSYPHPLISCMMPGIAVLTIIAVVLLALNMWERMLPDEITVPRVEGMPVHEAFAQLERAGLNVETIKEEQASEEIPADGVISANPAGGRKIKAGRTVRLVISSGSAYTNVPDVRELAQAVARERLQAANLVVTEEEYIFDKSVPFDRVISVTPRQGMRVQKLTAVKLVISKGPEEIETRIKPRPASPSVPVVKSTMLNVTIPTDGEPRAMLRIDVTDDDGERTVYQKATDAGSTVVQSVQGKGQVTAKVYYGNRLLLTRTF